MSTPMYVYCVRSRVVDASRVPHRFRTIGTVAVEARTYSQARYWGRKWLRWRGYPCEYVSLRREPERVEASHASA